VQQPLPVPLLNRLGHECKSDSKNSRGADSDSARVRTIAAYKDFLALWKEADPDVPILEQAKAEYAKLQ
jgi:hypothetical protein